MNYKIKMNKEDFFKVNDMISVTNLEMSDSDVFFNVEGGSLEIIKNSKYKYKMLDSFQNKIINFMSKYYLLVIGILFLFSILYINSYRVSKIRFNIDTPINDQIKKELESSFKNLYFFKFSNLNYETYSKKLRIKYSTYPYINVEFKNNIVDVIIYNFDDPNKIVVNDYKGDIIASKDGIVDVFYVYNGKNMISKNQYIKKGDVLISGTFLDKKIQASGMVMATTYEKITIGILKDNSKSVEVDNSINYYKLGFFDYTFNFGKDKEFNNYSKVEKNIFNLFDFFSIKQIEEIEKNDIIVSYSLDEALEEAKKLIEKDFLSNQINELEKIIDIGLIKTEFEDNLYLFTFIVKKYESIGVFNSY